MNEDIAIKVENISKVYPLRQSIEDENGSIIYEHLGLKGVSFEIKKGESVGIIGPNGSGKSTLLKILAGVTKPTSGEVKIRGKIASILDIGAGFHPELSGRENVYLNGQIHGFSKKEITAKFDKIVQFSGIEKFIEEPVKNYSNGMYLRLAFSIMAHLDFDVYLFDEVLSVGDQEFQNQCLLKIREISSTGKTFLIIHHNLWLADFVTTRTIQLVSSSPAISTFFPLADETITSEIGILKDIEIHDKILKKSKTGKITVAVKTMFGVNLAISEVVDVNDENKMIEMNMRLTTGKYRIEFFDIFQNSYRMIYSMNYIVNKKNDFHIENTIIF